MILSLFAGLAGAAYLFAVVLFFRGLGKFPLPRQPEHVSYSIIIAARNEEQNIAGCLTSVLAQTLSIDRYEVILVDDRSTDATRRTAESFAALHVNLRVLSITECAAAVSPKKNAILAGLALARNPIIVFTDADCRVPATWLETYDRYFSTDVAYIQGVTTFAIQSGIPKPLMQFQSVDFFSHAVVSAAAIGADLPINGNANNCAFRKTAFDAVGGYDRHKTVSLGDDDLLMQEIRRAGIGKVIYLPDEDAAVTTFAAPTLAVMLQQRTRWGSVTIHYGKRQATLLAGIFLFYCSIPVFFVLSFVNSQCWWITAVLVGLKICGELVLMSKACKRMGHNELIPLVPVASIPQLLVVLYGVMAGVFGVFSWKGQTMRSAQINRSNENV